jgi:hypothetical protein
MSIKKGVDYNGLVRNGDSFFHQIYVFPFRATQSLLSLNPMSESVKE